MNSQKQFGKKQEVQTDSGSGIFYKGTPAYKNIRLIKKLEPYIFLAVILGIFVPMSCQMGLRNMFRTMMYTAHDLLINTVFYIMAICVLAGALSDMLAEFGVIHVMQKIQPLF